MPPTKEGGYVLDEEYLMDELEELIEEQKDLEKEAGKDQKN